MNRFDENIFMDSSAVRTSTVSLTRPFVLVLLLLFMASVAIPKGEDVLLINGNHSPLLDEFFKTITHLGDGLILIPIAGMALFLRFRYVITIAAASTVVGLAVSLFKKVVFPGMARPKLFLDNNLIHFVPGVKVYTANSFPSGHTATAFCAALLIALLSRNKVLGIFALILATLVGCSRIYLAQHFLMDVVAGAILGYAFTFMTWAVVESNTLPTWTNRKLKGFKLKKPKKTVSQA